MDRGVVDRGAGGQGGQGGQEGGCRSSPFKLTARQIVTNTGDSWHWYWTLL